MLKVYSGLRRGIEASKSLRRVRRGFEGFEEALKGSKRYRRGSRGIEDFKGGFKGFEGVSHDNYPPFKIAATQRDGDARRKNGLWARSEFSQRGDSL